MDQLLHIHTEEIQHDHKDTYFNHRYEPTPYDVLEFLFDQFPLTKDTVFVDYGCGLGRLNFYVTHRFHCQTIGIEYNESYYMQAQENLSSCRHMAKEKISFHHISAGDYVLTDEETHLYFFNPFSIEIFMSCLANIQDSLARAPREVTLLLYYPDPEYLYYLENCTSFCLIETIYLSTYKKDSRECFLVFQAN